MSQQVHISTVLDLFYQTMLKELQNLRTSENSWLQGTLIDKSSLPNLHTYTETKLTQQPTSSSARHTMLILQQSRNTTLGIKRQAAESHAKPIDTPKLTRDTSLHSREKKSSSTHQNTDTSFPNQETLKIPPTARKPHNKDNSTNCQNTERSPQTQQSKQDKNAEKYSAGKGTW